MRVSLLEEDRARIEKKLDEQSDARLQPPTNVRNMLRSPDFVDALNRSVIEAIGPIMLPVVEQVQLIEKEMHERQAGASKREDPREDLGDQKIRQLIVSVVQEQLNEFGKSLQVQLDELRAQNEQLQSSVMLHTRLAFERLMEDEFRAAIGEQIRAQTAKSVNSLLQKRLKEASSSGLELDETFLNNSIRAQIQSLIHDKNLDKNSKPDYASELNNAIVLDASSTYTGKRGGQLISPRVAKCISISMISITPLVKLQKSD